jgi:hypothetical protein
VRGGSGSIDEVESVRSEEQRTTTSEQRIGRITLRARAIDGRDLDASVRSCDPDNDRDGRRLLDVEWVARLCGRGRARDVRDRAAARSTHGRLLRRRLALVLGGAAARRASRSVERTPVPRRRRDRWCEDEREQDENNATHVHIHDTRVADASNGSFGARRLCTVTAEDAPVQPTGARAKPVSTKLWTARPSPGRRTATCLRTILMIGAAVVKTAVALIAADQRDRSHRQRACIG